MENIKSVSTFLIFHESQIYFCLLLIQLYVKRQQIFSSPYFMEKRDPYLLRAEPKKKKWKVSPFVQRIKNNDSTQNEYDGKKKEKEKTTNKHRQQKEYEKWNLSWFNAQHTCIQYVGCKYIKKPSKIYRYLFSMNGNRPHHRQFQNTRAQIRLICWQELQ